MIYFKDSILSEKLFDKNTLSMASESAVIDTGKKMAVSVINKITSIGNKGANSKFVKSVNASKGDFTKMDEYKNIKICMDALVAMSKGGGYGVGVISDIENIRRFLIKEKELFSNGYKKKNKIVQAFYLTTISTLVASLNIAVLKLTNVGNGNVTWNKSAGRSILNNTFIKRAAELSEKITSGEIKTSLNKTFNSSSANASESVGLIVVGAIAGILLLIYFIRAAIMYFLDARVKFSDFLRNEADFASIIAMNNDKLDEKKRKKQEEYVKSLREAADAIDVDFSDDEDIVEKAIQKDRESIKREINVSEKKVNAGYATNPGSNVPAAVTGLDF